MTDMENIEDEKLKEGELEEQVDKQEDEESEITDSEKYKLNVFPSDIRVQDYKADWDRGRFEIPDFQRNYVWDAVRASRFIESFLLNLPVPPVFLYIEQGKDKYTIVDGQQRIISIVSFLTGEFVIGKNMGKKFTLKGVREEWVGKTFAGLDARSRFNLESAVMRSTIIEQISPEDNSSIYAIFERLNTGGMPLNNMEIRMCASHGSLSKLLKDLNEKEAWRGLLGKDADLRHRDLELILRFFALQENEYKSPMKRFLNDYMKENKDKLQPWLDGKQKLFEDAVNKVLSIKEKTTNFDKVKNISVLDSLLVALASSKTSDAESLKSFYENLIERQDYKDVVDKGRGTTETNTVRDGIRIAKEALANA